ncbi:MAG: MutS-related protein [Motilibacteraceae bacterium]
MRVRLMHPDREFAGPSEEELDEPCVQDLIRDLELDELLDLMAGSEDQLRRSARAALLSPGLDVATIRFRQQVLADCLEVPDLPARLYELAGEAITAQRGVFRSFLMQRPENSLHHAVTKLGLQVDALAQVRDLALEFLPAVRSPGWRRLLQQAMTDLDGPYLDGVRAHLQRLEFRDGMLLSAHLGDGNQGVGYMLREPDVRHLTLLHRTPVARPHAAFTIPERDEGGFRALADLRDRALTVIAGVVGQACDDVSTFFTQLRTELAFYLAATRLHGQLFAVGAPTCLPEPHPAGSGVLVGVGVYDPVLQVRLGGRAVPNDVDTEHKPLLLVTGANQGGKTTLLRTLGTAQLLLQAGLFVPAVAFTASTGSRVLTHFEREEDTGLRHGKFDEELARLSELLNHLRPGDLLLSNESFAATTENEGAAIGASVIRALADAGVRVHLVTHLHALADALHRQVPCLSLRPERRADGERTYRLVPAAPEPTSFGADLYEQVFGVPLSGRGPVARVRVRVGDPPGYGHPADPIPGGAGTLDRTSIAPTPEG